MALSNLGDDLEKKSGGRSLGLKSWDLTLSRAEVVEEIERTASRLRAECECGTRVVSVLGKNSGRTLITYLATMLSGAALVPLNAHLQASEIAHMILESESGLLIVDPVLLEVALAAARNAPDVRVVSWTEVSGVGYITLNEWLDGPSVAEQSTVRVSPPILFSSGTTGRPKRTLMPRTIFPRGATLAEYRTWAAGNRFVGQGPHLVSGPLNHSGPIQATALLASGVPVHIPRRFDPTEILETIEAERIASTLMVPTHFVRLLRAQSESSREYDVSSMRLVTQTGAGCPEETKRQMIDWWGEIFFETYGGTESGGVCAITSAEWLDRPNSVGRPVPGVRVLVIDDTGAEVPTGAEGRLYFENATGFGIEYEDAPELTAAAHLRPGVFTLGEIGRVDNDGYVYLTDRDSDKIVSGGVNIYPAEAERVLAEHPAVVDVAVIGIDNDEMGEEALALVVPAADRLPSADLASELVSFCRTELSAVKTPRQVRFVEAIERTAMGKLNRRELRRAFVATKELA
ncbi:AMP-binding protein [Rhodococcus sp. OK302]|uniref:AMP-binding protein n=1 Tax=Rhodococcus sp. OK302 TaxID=1882769 RepID=UPI000B9456CA|nr:AMP-binding protein [Rhodococcus sp. OK302]OYD61480.1 acyl-CoA synthetase (AMP-forming)/AMP-acid ligase II [Rhodococcus sp. OK302]